MRRYSMILAVSLAASAAQAETINVATLEPATSDGASELRSIVVETFGGDAGSELTFKVEDALSLIDLGNGPYFRIVPAGTGAGGEGLLRGTANSDLRFTNYTEERERCIKDEQGKCTSAKEKFVVKCRRRVTELAVMLRLVRRDGTLLWSDQRSETMQDSNCEDSNNSFRARGAVVRDLAGRVAGKLRTDFAPSRGRLDVRVDESRKGLSKPDADRFKAIVRMVKDRNVPGACQGWRDLAVTNPGHLPTQFNIGLCAESAGDDATAETQYRTAQSLTAARLGLDRIARRARAQRQIAAHEAD